MMLDDSNMYDESYFNTHYIGDKRRDAMYLQEIDRINKRVVAPGKILDVGCGNGRFLSFFDDRWEKHGIEPSAHAASLAQSYGVTIHPVFANLYTEYFDVVVFRGTLQHINEPMKALFQATRVLKPGGLLVILATPDIDSLVYKVFGNLPALDAPRNWVVFGQRMLRNIIDRLGYRNVEVIHPYIGTPYADPVGDVFNFVISLILGYRKFAWPGNQMEVYAVKK